MVQPYTFNNTQSLITVFIYNNNITFIPEFAFAGAPKFIFLSISNNPPMTFAYDALYGITVSNVM